MYKSPITIFWQEENLNLKKKKKLSISKQTPQNKEPKNWTNTRSQFLNICIVILILSHSIDSATVFFFELVEFIELIDFFSPNFVDWKHNSKNLAKLSKRMSEFDHALSEDQHQFAEGEILRLNPIQKKKKKCN